MGKKRERNLFLLVPVVTFWIFFGFSIALLIVTGVNAAAQTNENHDQIDIARRHEGYNLLVDSVAQDKNLMPTGSPAAVLLDDLNAFIETSDNASPFSPESTEEIVLPKGRYEGLDKQVGCVADDNGPDSWGCSDHGPLTSEFLLMYNTVQNTGEPDSFYKDIDKPLEEVYVYPWNWAWWQCYLALLLIANLISAIAYPAYIAVSWRGEYKKIETHGIKPMMGLIFGFPLYYIAIYRDLRKKIENRALVNTEKKLRQEKIEQEQLRTLNHPLHAELFTAKEKLKALESLAAQYPKDAKIKEAISVSKAAIAELEKFPDDLSIKAAQLLAEEVKAEMLLLTSVASSKLAAFDEVNQLK